MTHFIVIAKTIIRAVRRIVWSTIHSRFDAVHNHGRSADATEILEIQVVVVIQCEPDTMSSFDTWQHGSLVETLHVTLIANVVIHCKCIRIEAISTTAVPVVHNSMLKFVKLIEFHLKPSTRRFVRVAHTVVVGRASKTSAGAETAIL